MILYSPLWLGVEPPITDINDIVHWAKDIKQAQLDTRQTFDRTETIYDQGYELMHESGFVSMVTHPTQDGWFENFDKRFPELAAFFDRYPLNNKRIFCQTFTESEDMSNKVHMKFHTDRDYNRLAFRFSAFVDDKPRLIFRRIKKAYLQFYKSRQGRRCTFPNHHAEEHALRIHTPVVPHAWCMDTENVTHAIDGSPLNARSIFVIYGDMDNERLAEVALASERKYPDYVMTDKSFDAHLKALT